MDDWMHGLKTSKDGFLRDDDGLTLGECVPADKRGLKSDWVVDLCPKTFEYFATAAATLRPTSIPTLTVSNVEEDDVSFFLNTERES
jgi:hypothetical protein